MADDDQKKTESGADPKKTEKLTQDEYQEIFNKGFKTAEAKFKAKFDEINSKLEEYETYKAEKDREAEDLKLKELEDKKQWEEVKKNLTESFSKKEKDYNDKINTLNGRIKDIIVDKELYTWAAKKGVVPEATDDFVIALGRHIGFDIDEENGRTNYNIFPQSNGSRMLDPKTGNEMEMSVFIDKFLEEKAFYLPPKAGGGSGGRGSFGVPGEAIRNSSDAISYGLKKKLFTTKKE